MFEAKIFPHVPPEAPTAMTHEEAALAERRLNEIYLKSHGIHFRMSKHALDRMDRAENESPLSVKEFFEAFSVAVRAKKLSRAIDTLSETGIKQQLLIRSGHSNMQAPCVVQFMVSPSVPDITVKTLFKGRDFYTNYEYKADEIINIGPPLVPDMQKMNARNAAYLRDMDRLGTQRPARPKPGGY